MLRSILVFTILTLLWAVSKLFYRHEEEWLGDLPPRDWTNLRVIAILNHTSLAEIFLAGYAEIPLLWTFARHGVLPVAEKTMKRRIGMFFGMLVRHVVVITRQRDATWEKVLTTIDTESLVIILPEGRMMRADGLDSYGNPMTVRGGIADILEVLPAGRMLLLCSGGFHHIQVPGDGLPKLFQPIRARFELVDIAEYKRQIEDSLRDDETFRQGVVSDLTDRRDRYRPSLDGGRSPVPFDESPVDTDPA